MYRLIGILLTTLTVLAEASAPRADSVTTYGAGLRTCQEYLEARDGTATEQVPFIDWLSGYISAVNRTSMHRNNVLGLGDVGAALERLDGNCRAIPSMRFAEAASLLIFGSKPGPAAHALDVTTYGTADAACQVFVDARAQQETEYWADYVHWLGGYLSGVNFTSLKTNNVLAGAELTDAVRWLDGYCSSHPVTAFGAAVEVLITAGRPANSTVALDATPGSKMGQQLGASAR